MKINNLYIGFSRMYTLQQGVWLFVYLFKENFYIKTKNRRKS